MTKKSDIIYVCSLPLFYKCSNFIAISLEVHDNKAHTFLLPGNIEPQATWKIIPYFFAK